jgi:epoxyqueuosine reductase
LVREAEKRIIAAAAEQGFILTGFAPLRALPERREFFDQWIGEGRAAEMAWLAREPERRIDPRVIDGRLRSVVSLAFPYTPPRPRELDWRAELRGRIAAYAIGPDYHDIVLAKARVVAEALTVAMPGAIGRVYVDTGPVFEREWAMEARLGWIGRNTNILNRYNGSYFFLAEILTDAEFEASGEPYREHCGTCRRCLDLCPTGALAEGYRLEPRLCISYLTIEHRGAIPLAMRAQIGNWIFGCDVCQEVCPWNDDHTRAAPTNEELTPSLAELMELDDDGFRQRFARSAIKRTKRRGLLRNAAVVLGNSGNPAAIPILTRTLASEVEALVRSHAAWALGQIGGAAARRALEAARLREPDAAVLEEIETAITHAFA